MMLTERTEEIRVETDQSGCIFSVLAHIVERDGVEIAREIERKTYAPGDDVSGASQAVQALAGALWTADVIAAYRALG